MTEAIAWGADILGDGFEAATLALPDDAEGPVVATLVRHRAPTPAPARGAVLYLHGYNDYFFQADLARFFSAQGWAFYALDLRKYGRSLLPHQTPNFCRSLEDYDPELDAAAAVIADEIPGPLLLVAHSTGGLTGPLWAARRGGRVAGMVLNSPFLDFREPPAVTAVLIPAVKAASRRWPMATFPAGGQSAYNDSLHVSRSGEWDYDLAWKRLASVPVRLGWLAAIASGQGRVRQGLGLTMPILAMSSSTTARPKASMEELHRGDAVLNAARIARAATALGSNVTVVRVAGGMHDLFLSPLPARAEAYAATGRWLDERWPAPTPLCPPD